MTQTTAKKGKPEVKRQILIQFLVTILSSKLMNVFILTIVTGVIGSVSHHWQPLLLPVIFGLLFCQRIIFEILVVSHAIESNLGLFDWYSVVDDNLLLGAIPLYEMHYDLFIKKLNISAIVTINQPYELSTTTMVGRPVTSTEWKKRNIEQLLLHSPDFFPPSFKLLDEGSQFINEQIINNRRVYCHCKSGKGRSASIILAYFMRYKSMDVRTAHKLLKLKRKIIFSEYSPQYRNLEAYQDFMRTGKKY